MTKERNTTYFLQNHFIVLRSDVLYLLQINDIIQFKTFFDKNAPFWISAIMDLLQYCLKVFYFTEKNTELFKESIYLA